MIQCKDCYTSDISVAAESIAAYHGSKSRATNNLSLDDGTVFKGKAPSRFFFELSPAMFEDLTQRGDKTEYGYRVSSILTPEYGTTSDLSSLYLNNNIMVKVEFSMSQTGVYTGQMYKLDIYGFIGITAGAIGASYAALGIIMNIFEFLYFKLFKFKDKPIISIKNLYLHAKSLKSVETNDENKKNRKKIVDEKLGNLGFEEISAIESPNNSILPEENDMEKKKYMGYSKDNDLTNDYLKSSTNISAIASNQRFGIWPIYEDKLIYEERKIS